MKIFLMLFLSIILIPCYAQQVDRCGLPTHLQSQGKIFNFSSPEIRPRSQIEISIVFHSLYKNQAEYISDAKIIKQVEIINSIFSGNDEDFRELPQELKGIVAKRTDIVFCLAIKDGDYGIIRRKVDQKQFGLSEELFFDSKGGSSAWDTRKYLNVWIADTGENLAGYGTFPGQVDSSMQGVVIGPKFFGLNNSTQYGKGKVLVHEIAHYLGLNHPWGSCIDNDLITDTPNQEGAFFGCPRYPQESCESIDLTMNYMDYVDDECMYLFTKGQYNLMYAVLTSMRPGLACGVTSECIDKNVVEALPQFKLYPNPTLNEVNILFDHAINGIVGIDIFSSTGSLILHEVTFVIDKADIDVTLLSSGLYFIKVQDKIEPFIKI